MFGMSALCERQVRPYTHIHGEDKPSPSLSLSLLSPPTMALEVQSSAWIIHRVYLKLGEEWNIRALATLTMLGSGSESYGNRVVQWDKDTPIFWTSLTENERFSLRKDGERDTGPS
ncbi:hypothetical protein E4U32_001573 [Claviceps aff. humidiphila group G2b]|nr:hypothetical protein E4U32_001573 [Claviceps aff. humidiphila group G2b]